MQDCNLTSKRDFYIQTESGQLLLVEIEENRDWIHLTIGENKLVISPQCAFELADGLTMVATDASFYIGENYV